MLKAQRGRMGRAKKGARDTVTINCLFDRVLFAKSQIRYQEAQLMIDQPEQKKQDRHKGEEV